MTTRFLPKSEHPRLAGTELEAVWPHLGIEDRVIVVEDDDQIVGCWAVFPVLHCEGLWIHPDYRKRPSVARRLWRTMRDTVASMGKRTVVTAACSHEIEELLTSAKAFKMPGAQYVITVEDRCQQP